jgi:hypothetical protein
MTLYVAQISGRGIVAFEASDEDEAKARIADMAFRRDLIVFQHGGRPLWDGVSEIELREALPRETETWQASGATEGKSSRAKRRVFLVPIVDPLKFADHRDDHDDDHDESRVEPFPRQ